MFCQAHETYAEGLGEANQVLSEMRQHPGFLRFLKEPPQQPGQPSISAFIFRPLQVTTRTTMMMTMTMIMIIKEAVKLYSPQRNVDKTTQPSFRHSVPSSGTIT